MQCSNQLFNCFSFENDIKYNQHPNSDLFMTKKLSRFIFPTKDTIDPSWVTTPVSPFEALNHLINLSWTRLTDGEIQVWNEMCGRRVQDKEVTALGLYKTEHDLRKARTEYKREQQRLTYIDHKKADDKVKIKGLIMSKNKIIQSSNKEISQVHLTHSFKHNKEEIAQYLEECLNFSFSKSTKKVLRKFKAQLFTCSVHKAKYFIRYLANCLSAIRAQSAKIESPTGLVILNLTTMEAGAAGTLPYARGCLAPSEAAPLTVPFHPTQTKLISFLIDSGSMVNIMSINHLKKLQFNTDMVRAVEREYIIESSTEIKNNCIFGTLDLKIYLLGEDGKFYQSDIHFLIAYFMT